MSIPNQIHDVLRAHEQHFQNSCAASGMELALKLHSLVPLHFRDFQDRYQDQNIGFEKLSDMSQFGVSASDHEEPLDCARAMIRDEFAEGRYPIVSLPNNEGCWHIWIAVPDGDKIVFLSRGFGSPMPLRLDDSAGVTHVLGACRQGKLHFVTYKITQAEQGGAGQPATRSESKPESNQRPQPESEGRSR